MKLSQKKEKIQWKLKKYYRYLWISTAVTSNRWDYRVCIT